MGKATYHGLKTGPVSPTSFVLLGGPSKRVSPESSTQPSESNPSPSLSTDEETEAQLKEAKSTQRITGGSDF